MDFGWIFDDTSHIVMALSGFPLKNIQINIYKLLDLLQVVYKFVIVKI